MKTEYDTVVIGGGAAGIMTAGVANRAGKKVILLEKNDMLGKKLLITGGGRCNITNAEYDTRKFLEKLGISGKFLFSTFDQFNVQSTFDFFESRGLKIKIENLKRAFPESDKASSVLDVLLRELPGADICLNVSIKGFKIENKKLIGVEFTDGSIVKGKQIILATGGTSHPETGSTGDGYTWLKAIGHTVVIPKPSLVPIAIKDSWVKNLAGITLSDTKLTVIQGGEKQFSKKGRLLFTHFGVSGPTVINMSKDIGESLKYGDVTLRLDLFPSLDHGMMNTKILELFENNKNKFLKNTLNEIVPSGIVETILNISEIVEETPVNSVSREERMKLIETLKNLNMHVDYLLGPEKSIVTSGGISCEEVNFKTMQSKLYPNLYFAGDILNIERPSGGYSLQICWSTGFVAGIQKID